MRQAPDWMNLKDGELYIDKDMTLFVSDLKKFLNEQGVVPLDIYDRVQKDAHTFIFGKRDSTLPSSVIIGTSGAHHEVPSLVPSVNDPVGTINDHSSSSLYTSSQDRDTADLTGANDDLIITQSSPDVRTGAGTKCDGDDIIAQENEVFSQEKEKLGTPRANQPALQSEGSLSDDVKPPYDDSDTEELEYSVSKEEIGYFTKETEYPSSQHEHSTKNIKSVDEKSEGEIREKIEL